MKILTAVFSNHCNLDCSYCCIGSKGNSPVLSKEQVLAFVKEYMDDDSNILEFYGGEPLMHSEDIIGTIDCLTSIGIRDRFSIRLYTNGVNLTSEPNWTLCHKYVDDILISLDGIDYESNKQRFTSEEQFESVVSGIRQLSNSCGPEISLSQVLFGKEKYMNMFEVFEHFYDMIDCFSYEPITVWNDDRPVVIPKEHMELFLRNIWRIIHFIATNDSAGEKSLFVAKELMSSKFYPMSKENCCSSVARAISPRGNVYMCRDHAANEEHIFYGPKVIQFGNKNNLKEQNGNFDHIYKYENTYTPCVVKDFQYIKHGNPDALYWLEDDFQQLFIMPLYHTIIGINEGNRTKEFISNIETYMSQCPFETITKGIPNGLLS